VVNVVLAHAQKQQTVFDDCGGITLFTVACVAMAGYLMLHPTMHQSSMAHAKHDGKRPQLHCMTMVIHTAGYYLVTLDLRITCHYIYEKEMSTILCRLNESNSF
jgi:hypothetical protein